MKSRFPGLPPHLIETRQASVETISTDKGDRVQLSREKVAKTALNGDREQNVGSSELREGGALRLGGGVKKAG